MFGKMLFMNEIPNHLKEMIDQIEKSRYVYINSLNIGPDFEEDLIECLQDGLYPPVERIRDTTSFSGSYSSVFDPEVIFATTARKGRKINMWRNPGYSPFGLIIDPSYVDHLNEIGLVKPDGSSWSFEGKRIYRRIPAHKLIGLLMEIEPTEAAKQTNELIKGMNDDALKGFGIEPVAINKMKTFEELMRVININYPWLGRPVFDCDWNLVYPK